MNTDEADAAEATVILNMIYLVKNGPQYPEKVPKTSHCLAMLYFLREDGVKVTSSLGLLNISRFCATVTSNGSHYATGPLSCL